MSGEHEMCFSDGNSPRELVDEKVEDTEEVLTEDLPEEWLFPRPGRHLATTLRSGEVRPLSPTLKIYSPENVFPGIAVLREGFDDMREWKNTIEFVGFFARTQGKMFNSRHHWDMRTKFLEVRLRCMDRIIEDPSRVYSMPEGGFFWCVPVTVEEDVQEERSKMKLARDVEGKDCVPRKPRKDSGINKDGDSHIEAKKQLDNDDDNLISSRDAMKETSNLKKQTNANNELGITMQEKSNVAIENFAMSKDGEGNVENLFGDNPCTGRCRVEISATCITITEASMVSEDNQKKPDVSSTRKNAKSISGRRMASKAKKNNVFPTRKDSASIGRRRMVSKARKTAVFGKKESDKCIDDFRSSKQDVLSSSYTEVTLEMLREQYRLRKENVSEKDVRMVSKKVGVFGNNQADKCIDHSSSSSDNRDPSSSSCTDMTLEMLREQYRLRKQNISEKDVRMDSKKVDIFGNNETDKCIDHSSSKSDNRDPSSSSSADVTLEMLREQYRRKKEQISEKMERSAEDEKLKRESLQKGLNIGSRRESEKREHISASNEIETDWMQDIIVIGKSIQAISSFTAELDNETEEHSVDLSDMETENPKKGMISKSETWSHKVQEELVLEDINDKDFVQGSFLPSSSKLTHVGVEDDPSEGVATNSSKAKASTSVVCTCGKLDNQPTIEQPKQGKTLSRLGRLRRRIGNLFSCFRRNQVIPVDI